MNVDSRTGLATILASAFLILGVLLFIGGSDDSDADVLTDGDETTIVTGTQTVTYKVVSASNETCEVSYFTSSNSGDITIPESVSIKGIDVTVIGLGTGCADEGTVGTITLPDTIEYIGDCAFQNASFFSINLDSLTNLTTLGVGAFAYVGIDGPDKILTIPASVTNIGTRAFGTTNYNNINEGVQLAEGNTAFKIANGMLLSMDGTRLLRVNDTGHILTVPATVTNIDSSAFEPSAYKMIVIEGTPTIVDESETVQFYSGHYMFYNYVGTKPMVVAVSAADMSTLADNGFGVANISPISHGSLGYFIDDGKYYLSFAPESGYYLQNWTKNETYVDPSEELEIVNGDVISATVNAIPEDQELDIDDGVQLVRYKVISFENATCKVVYFESDGALTIPSQVNLFGFDMTVIGLGRSCADEGTVGAITLPDTIEFIDDYAFQNASFFSINLASLTNLTTLGKGAFANVGVDGPDKILTIPASVTTIGTRAFGTTTYNNINEGVQLAEGNTAFKVADGMLLSMDGTRLLRVNDTGDILTIPASITNIDSTAFEPSVYKMIVIEGTPTIVDDSESVQFNSGHYMFYNYVGTKPMVVAVSSVSMTSIAGNGYEVANISPISHGTLGYSIDGGKYYLSFSPEYGYYLQNWTKNETYVDPSEEIEIVNGDKISATVNVIPEDQELDIDDGVQLVRYKVISFEDATCKAIYFESDGALTIPSQVNLFGFDMTVIGLGEYCADEGVFGAVTLPDTIEFIDKFAFQNATVDSINLASLTNLTEIKDGGFAYLEITGTTKTLTIPASVTSIGTRAFGTSTYANINQGVNVASGNTAFKVADGMLLSMDGKRLLRVNSTEGAVIVPASVETIDDYAFETSNHTMVVIKGTPTIATDGATVPFNSDLNYLFTAYGAEKPIVVAESNTDLANIAGKGYAVANVLPNANGTFSYSFDGGKAYVSFAPASGYIAKNWVKNGADVALSDKLEIADGDTVSMAVEADPNAGGDDDDKKDSNLVLYAAIAAVAVVGALAAVYVLFLRPKA